MAVLMGRGELQAQCVALLLFDVFIRWYDLGTMFVRKPQGREGKHRP
jgi:hypothetical protein